MRTSIEVRRPGKLARPAGLGAQVSGSVQTAVSLLPPDEQQAISQVQGQVSDEGPLISLAQTAGSGGTPSPAAVVAGLSAAATLLTGNPIAGAAIAMAGGLVAGATAALQGLFTALGLYSSPPALYNYNGLRRIQDVAPSGQLDPDWWFIKTGGSADQQGVPETLSSGDLWRIHQGQTPPGVIAHPPVQGFYNGPANALFGQVLAYYDLARRFGTPFGDTSRITPSSPLVGGAGATYKSLYGNVTVPRSLTPFEIYLAPLLRQTLENWANGIGFVMPRDVLAQAALVWNKTHQPGTPVTFHPFDLGTPWPAGGVPFVDSILGGGGDLKGWSSNTPDPTTRLPPLTINTGPMLHVVPVRVPAGGYNFATTSTAPPTVALRVPAGGYNFATTSTAPPAATATTGGKVAIGTAVAVGGIFAVGSLWALFEHQTIGYFWGKAFDKTWDGIKGVFGK